MERLAPSPTPGHYSKLPTGLAKCICRHFSIRDGPQQLSRSGPNQMVANVAPQSDEGNVSSGADVVEKSTPRLPNSCIGSGSSQPTKHVHELSRAQSNPEKTFGQEIFEKVGIVESQQIVGTRDEVVPRRD